MKASASLSPKGSGEGVEGCSGKGVEGCSGEGVEGCSGEGAGSQQLLATTSAA